MEKITFSDRLKLIIEEKNIRQIDLCQKTGIGKSAMSQYLHGSFEPKQQNLHALAEALDVSEAWLMGYDVPRSRKKTSFQDQQTSPIIHDSNVLYFTVPDDSMSNANLPKNAIAVIQEQPVENIQNGQIVYFSTQDDKNFHLRFFYRKQESLILLPANPGYDPAVYDAADLTEGKLHIFGIARQAVIQL